MTITTLELIEGLENESIAVSASDRVSFENDREKRLQITANTLRRFRDTLISIANCRNGMASHQAQDALIETGECAHFNSVFHFRGDGNGKYVCHDCNRESDERIGAFE